MFGAHLTRLSWPPCILLQGFVKREIAMIRRAAAYVFAASLALATTPAFSCTGISLKAQDGAAIRARTLEFGFPLKSNVIIVPAGQEFSGSLPDGGKGLTYKARFDIVGANALNETVIIDGLNDQGLSIGLVYFRTMPNTPMRRRKTRRALLRRKISACGCSATSPRSTR